MRRRHKTYAKAQRLIKDIEKEFCVKIHWRYKTDEFKKKIAKLQDILVSLEAAEER